MCPTFQPNFIMLSGSDPHCDPLHAYRDFSGSVELIQILQADEDEVADPDIDRRYPRGGGESKGHCIRSKGISIMHRSHKRTPISGGSRISLRRGRQLPGGAPTYDFAKFPKNCMKLKEFGPPRGGVRPQRPPALRSATANIWQFTKTELVQLEIEFLSRV